MDPYIIIIVVLFIIISIFGIEYINIRKKIKFIYEVFDRIVDVIGDDEIGYEEKKELTKKYKDFIRNIK